ncbi:helix-turn-helix domain-containing protein [Pseudonocardia sp. KRD291]|uniref:winged helix-turn-helix transcriptional regulator n=1 Tax=Pseudonocardia sp. KRD291 TaxID=2792007 RepID=UPI001C4A0E4B|nr:helix-turn-helix domain-containing protein [Pseudonocardia sp. KRD291]MBW0103933.1 helix-turn-helix transcriptional regulator [Pseudonocardia sp. KRD291]
MTSTVVGLDSSPTVSGPGPTGGLGSNVLNDRLRLLVDHGVLERVRYQDNPPRHEYRLTAKGADLYPVLLAVMAWGDHCAEPVGWRDMTAEFEPDAW